MKYASDHKKIIQDLYRLCVFSKIASIKYNAKHMFQVMATGTNIQFYISEVLEDIQLVTELDSIRLPLSLDELPQTLPYLGRLYNVVEAVHRCCYVNEEFDIALNGHTLEPSVIKAITKKIVDRKRPNYFSRQYH